MMMRVKRVMQSPWRRAAVRVWDSALSRRALHQTPVVFARRNRRTGRKLGGIDEATTPMRKTVAVVGHEEDREHDNDSLGWLGSVNEGALEAGEPDELDEEMDELLSDMDELFSLDPDEFQKRMEKMDDEERSSYLHRPIQDEDDEGDAERARTRIPRRRLLKMLDGAEPFNTASAQDEGGLKPVMKSKAAAPLEKKPKLDPERISHRQERLGVNLQNFIQHLLLQDADTSERNVFAHVTEVSVSPDLRRAVVYWEPARNDSTKGPIAKKKVQGLRNRLIRMEKWVRVEVTRHINLKYSPIITFKQRRKTSKTDEYRRIFDEEMSWLEHIEK